MSKLFFRTLREVPADAEIASHQLMLRATLIHPIAAGIFDYLPLGQRIKAKVERIFREEMDAIDGQEVTLPMVHPAEMWQRTGRWQAIGSDMARLKDAGGRDMCLGMTHEEIMADLAAHVVRSYRQLPFMLYQIQTKFRDERRPRGGLIRVREFTMKDAYSFDTDLAGLDAYYPRVYQAYFNIFHRCGLEVLAVESDTGMMGGTMAHEFMAITPVGEDTLLICDACPYKANRQVAVFRKPEPMPAAPAPLEAVSTPDTTTIEDLAGYLGIPAAATAKAVFMVATVEGGDAAAGHGTDGDGKRDLLVFAVVRGDMELNETKLSNAVKALALRPAQVEEVRAIGAEPGYGSPVGIRRDGVVVVVDDLVARSPNLVAGANRVGYHLRNVNHGRDYTADLVADIAAAAGGHGCPRCGTPLRAVRGVEVGNIFKLGTKYSAAMGAVFDDEDGQARPIVMGSYGIGTGRLMASVIEAHHDEAGMIWPISIAPFHVALLALANERSPEVAPAADAIYGQLVDAGLEVLYDDRAERPGVKFNDADLIGLPVRVTVGGRGLQSGVVELRIRRTGETREVPLADVVAGVSAACEGEWAWIRGLVREMPLATDR
ncbi:proline--tRNA ligase [bacterium]|nr:proline--tRNA ligase [Chloroflexi bacterium CFX6]RIL12276.1 MAG: proline--tRNA ligase [bacterium]